MRRTESEHELHPLMRVWIENYTKLAFSRALRLAKRGNYGQAEKELNHILEMDSSFKSARIVLGKVYAQQGRYEEAIREWQRVLETDPHDEEVKAAIKRAEEHKRGIGNLTIKMARLKIGIALLLIGLGISFLGNVWLAVRSQATFPQFMSRDELEKKVINSIQLNRNLKDYRIKVTRAGSTVCLFGDVPTFYIYSMLISVTKDTPGVTTVDSTGVRIAGTYTVKEGDTLAWIARQLYDDSSRWVEIYEKNKSKISQPNRLLPGTRLIVPPF